MDMQIGQNSGFLPSETEANRKRTIVLKEEQNGIFSLTLG
jgi:hypothetical protein